MKVLVVSNLYPPHVLGGYEILCAQVARRLADRGHQVVVATHRGEGSADGVRVRGGLELEVPFSEAFVEDPLRRRRLTHANFRRTTRLIAEEAPDVIFLWSQLRLTLGPALAAEASGRPVVHTLNDEHLAGFLPRRWSATPRSALRAIADRTLLRGTTTRALRARRLLVISETLRRSLVDQGVPASHTRVIHQGIPLERFPLREHPGTVHDPVRILYVGQLHPYKGPHTAIEAAHRVARGSSSHSVCLTLAGDGDRDYLRSLHDQAARGPAGVEFLGRLEHDTLSSLYRKHDLFVFPSEWEEPFGLTHLEAMASGLPVVSTSHGGPAEFLRHGYNALLFEPADAGGCARMLTRLAEDEMLRKRIIAAGRGTVEMRFSIDRYVDELQAELHAATGAAA